jgi:hypothetical protein
MGEQWGPLLLTLIQSDLVSLSLAIALPKALGSASAEANFLPARALPTLVSIANHAGVALCKKKESRTHRTQEN